MTKTVNLVAVLREEWDEPQGALMKEAADEIDRLRNALQSIVHRWKYPSEPLEGESPLEMAICERDELYALASSALEPGGAK